MKTIIYAKVTNRAEQTFYVKVNGKQYFLFAQDYRKSFKAIFAKGVYLDDLKKLFKHHSAAVRMLADKISSYLRYVESEYGVIVYNKMEMKQKVQKVKTPYKRTPFIWRQACLEVI